MTPGPGPQFRKEIRALLPWWAGTVGVLGICRLVEPIYAQDFPFQDRLLAVSLFTYALGAICLGALSIGHEYGNRVLPNLLTQPVSRQQLLVVKAGALSVLLALLALAAHAAFDLPSSWPTSPRISVIFWLPLLCGLCLAPWLTMASRGTLPGVVFTVAVPVVLFITGGTLGVPYAATWPIVGSFAVVAAALTWRAFVRLEATGDRSSELDFAGWSTAESRKPAGGTAGHPYGELFAKELRLQQITFVLAGFFTVLWIAVSLIERLSPNLLHHSIRYAAALVHGGLVSILCGALASAEERRLGTADSQRLLPVTHRAQWVIKMGTALGVALLLAAALPAALHAIAPEPLMSESFHPVAAFLLCASALYVSSLTDSGIHATLATVPAMAVAAGTVVLVIAPAIGVAAPLIQQLAAWVYPLLDITQPDWRWFRYPLAAAWIMGVVLVLAFAAANHRAGDRSRARILRQCAWLVALVLVALLTSTFTSAVMFEWQREVMPRGLTGSAR